jgi:hypothetical protein
VELSSLKNSLTFLVSFIMKFKKLTKSFYSLELAQNPLVKRVIAVLDKNKDGNISFLEFV